MATSINVLQNAAVFIGSESQIGRAEEVTLPEAVTKMAEHKALGLNGVVEVPVGLEKMSAKIKWAGLYRSTLAKVADPFGVQNLMVRGSIREESPDGTISQKACVAYITGRFKKFPGIGIKPGEPTDAESELSVHYYKLVIDGLDVIEIDVWNNVHKAGGVDALVTFRAHLGQ